LSSRGIDLIPVDAPDHFTDPGPTTEMVRQILGAVSQFEKSAPVAKLRHARERKPAETGRCEGRKPGPAEVIAEARSLARRNPKTGEKRSLREIAAELAQLGHLSLSARPASRISPAASRSCSGGTPPLGTPFPVVAYAPFRCGISRT
jgi:DNA invertase Pin-like site-specific DNA recombinase